MLLPGLFYLFVNNYVPLIGLVVAFKDYNYSRGIFNSLWVGLRNFKYLFKTESAFIITRNTLFYNLSFIAVNTAVSILVALLLNEIKNAIALKFFQTVILLPYLISTVVISYLVYAFLSAQTGFMNFTVLPMLGKSSISWYTEPALWPFILTIVNLWKNFGFLTIIYYASIIAIDEEYYEAASLDGANRIAQIWHVTLPTIKPVVILMMLMAIGRIFFTDFGLFYQVPMDSGMLYSTTNTIDTYVYRALMKLGDFGMASAAGVYQSFIGFLLVLISNMIVRKTQPESAIF
jgi:putative aldouronate transport system permease protein